MDGRFFLAVLPSAIESTHLDHQLSIARAIGFRRESLRQSAVGTAPRAPDTRMELPAVASNAPSDVRPALLATAHLHSPFPETRIQAGHLLMERPSPAHFIRCWPSETPRVIRWGSPHSGARDCAQREVSSLLPHLPTKEQKTKKQIEHEDCDGTSGPGPRLLADVTRLAGRNSREQRSAQHVPEAVRQILRSGHNQRARDHCPQNCSACQRFPKWFVGFHFEYLRGPKN